MDITKNEHNLIKKILDNKSDYTELRITNDNYSHFANNRNEYDELYGSFEETKSLCSQTDDLLVLIKNAMTKNEYINQLHMTCGYLMFGSTKSIYELLSIRMFKAIYIERYSKDVLDYLCVNQISTLEKLGLTSICRNIEIFRKVIENCKLLKILNITLELYNTQEVYDAFEIINKSNIAELTLNFDLLFIPLDFVIKYGNFVSKNKTLRKLHIHYFHENIDFDSFLNIMMINYNIIDFKINDRCDEKIKNRNKKYIMTIFLCMNKKIIPRCIFRNLILSHII